MKKLAVVLGGVAVGLLGGICTYVYKDEIAEKVVKVGKTVKSKVER